MPSASEEPPAAQQHSNSAVTADTGGNADAEASSSRSTAGIEDAAAHTEPAVLREAAERCRRLWEEDEWVELHPRWPLTNRLHARAQAAVAGRPKSQGLKRKRLHRSLTELTAEALAARGCGDGDKLTMAELPLPSLST